MSDTTEAMRAAPCPFCGEVGLMFSQGSTNRWVLAECPGCGASPGEFRTKQDCVATWNRRTPAAPAVTDSTRTGAVPDAADLATHSWPIQEGGLRLGVPNGVLLVHKPTGIGVAVTRHRSQHQNRDEARTRLFGMLTAQPSPERNECDEGKDHTLIEYPVLREVFQAYDREKTGHWMRLRNVAELLRQARAERNDCEPVAWQHRTEPDEDWVGCSREFHDWVLRKPVEWPGNEVRALYTAPPPPAERHYCERCSKRLGHTEGVHTCTPPGDEADGWPRLEKDAALHEDGSFTFGRGVSAELLVKAAYRNYERTQDARARTPEQRAIDEASRRALWDLIHGAPPVSITPEGGA